MRRVASGALVLVLVAGLLACSGSGDAPRLAHTAGTVDYRPGLGADLFLPARRGRVPLVVLIPGGGWETADRSGLRPLADRFAALGLAATTATYRAGDSGAYFPVPVGDVECAVDTAVVRARAAGITPAPVVLLGHSAGAQLAALAALTGDRFRSPCPAAPVRVDAVVGLSGPYDIDRVRGLALSLVGTQPATDPSGWRLANPMTWAGERRDLPVLLVHGADDRTVPPSFTTSFADALRSAGHRVTVEIVPGADHASIYRPEVAAARVVAWIRQLCACV